MANRRYDDPRRFEGRGRSEEEEERLRRGPERTGRSGREYARGEGAFYDEQREEHERPRGYGDRTRPTRLLYDTDTWGYGTRGFGEPQAPRGAMEERIRRDALRRDVREPHTYDRRYGPMYGHGPGVENMPPPSIGYATSPTRLDDHETGHGGFMGGGYRREEVGSWRAIGRGPKGYQRADERIREDVCERLMRGWMDASEVDVQVKDGEVTLEGSVRSREEKHAIENVAADILGVKDVHNHLRVQQGGVYEQPDLLHPVEPPSGPLHS